MASGSKASVGQGFVAEVLNNKSRKASGSVCPQDVSLMETSQRAAVCCAFIDERKFSNISWTIRNTEVEIYVSFWVFYRRWGFKDSHLANLCPVKFLTRDKEQHADTSIKPERDTNRERCVSASWAASWTTHRLNLIKKYQKRALILFSGSIFVFLHFRWAFHHLSNKH